MEEIVPVTAVDVSGVEILTCDARSLHQFLGVGRDFSTWLRERTAKYGFVEGVDFIPLPISGEQKTDTWGGHNKIDYALSLDMAKELAMVENNERGRQVRRYFIACEQRAREISRREKLPLRQQAEMFLEQVIQMERLEQAQADQAKRIEEVEVIATTALSKAESNYGQYTVLAWFKINGLSITLPDAATHGRRLTEICHGLGVEVGKVRDPRFGLVNTYPENILQDYFDAISKQPAQAACMT